MSDIFKNLKSLFVEEDPKAKRQQTTSNTSEKQAPTPQKPLEPSIDFDSIQSAPGETKSKFTKILLQAIEKHNLAGFDYLEFKNGLKSLAKMEMDDATRYKSAFAMAQTMGTSKSKLLDSAKHYQSVLSTEKEHFEKAAQQQMQVKVVGRKEEMKVWEQEVKAKEKQIEKLQKEIASLKQKIQKTSGSLDVEAQKVKKTQLDFIASHDYIYQQIQEDIDKMTQYL